MHSALREAGPEAKAERSASLQQKNPVEKAGKWWIKAEERRKNETSRSKKRFDAETGLDTYQPAG